MSENHRYDQAQRAGQPSAPDPQQSYPPVRRPGRPPWAIVAICVPAVLVSFAILAAVAIPTFLNQRDKAIAAETTVAMPVELVGLPPSPDTAARQRLQGQLENLKHCGCLSLPVAEVYADAGQTHTLFIAAATLTAPFHSDDRAEFVRGFWHASRSAAGNAAVGEPQDRDPGKLGGTLSCAPLIGDVSGVTCVAIDAGSVVVLTDIQPGSLVSSALPTRAREAVVHRD
jgi:hypothetical protein